MSTPPLISPVNNPHYPLPADYEGLTDGGQWEARIAASRQWLIPGTAQELADRLVASTWFFDSYYLCPDPEGEFEPGFYDSPPLSTPPFHWDLSRTWATNRLNVALAPRGSAKSTHNRKDMLLRLVSSPMYSFVYATSSHDNAKQTGQIVRDQLYTNSRIHDDWSVEYDRPLKPMRGDKPTGVEFFYANNGSWVRCISAESRLRGWRPRRFRLDDPEYDEKATTSMQQTRDYMERLLFKVALPMVMRARCGIDWVGTFVSRRHYLWHALSVIQTASGPRAADPRFEHWARLLIRAIADDGRGNQVSCWPEMWPLTRKDKELAGLTDSVSLEEMKEIMGVASFNNEMLGRPGTTEEQFFKLDSAVNGRHAYWIESPDDQLNLDPRYSEAKVCWSHPDGHIDKVRMGDWLTTVRLFMTVDTAYTEKTTSDRRVVNLMALTRDNELFLLDLWSDKKGDDILVKKTFEMAQKWRCPVVFVEVVKESFKLYQRFRSIVSTRLVTEMGFTHTPAIRDIKPGMMSKTDKISTLDLRFEHALIKFPVWRRYEQPWWTRLFDQIEGFNPEVADGGLEKDDELDTTAMSLFVVKSKLSKTQAEKAAEPPNPIEEMKKGNFEMAGGAAYGMGLNLDQLDAETIGSLLSNAARRDAEGNAVATRV